MKLIALLLLLPTLAFAYQVEVINPCSGDVQISVTYNTEEPVSAWDASEKLLSAYDVAYLEGSFGKYFESILDVSAFTEVTDAETKYWGWTYTVNGEMAPVGAGEFFLTNDDKAVWEYGYWGNNGWESAKPESCK